MTVLHLTPTADELALLRQSVRETLASIYPSWPDDHGSESWIASWDRLAQQGFWSTLEPPDGSLGAAAVVAEELGRALYPGPAYEALVGAYVRRELGSGASSAGQGTMFTPADSPSVEVPRETMLIVATDGDELLTIPAAEAETCAAPSIDVSRQIVDLRFDKNRTPVTSFDQHLARLGRAAQRLLYCADTLGCVDHVLARTGEYAQQRTTFGSPIGKYQAVAHRLVDHAVTTRQMRLLLDGAVAAFDGRAEDIELRVATAEAFFSGRSADVVSDCIQLCGAIAFTWEFGHHFYLRRVVQNASLGGGLGSPFQRLAEESAW